MFMEDTNNTGTIELLWKPEKEFLKDNKGSNSLSGLYQIYGTHPIYGRNVLLYIGMSTSSLVERVKKHRSDWIKFEYDEVSVYFGTLFKASGPHENDWIQLAEALLIYYCAPAYNSNLLTDIPKQYQLKNLTVRNYGQIGSLPTEVSTLWYRSDIWESSKF